MIVKMGHEYGLDDASILKRIQDEIGLSLEQVTAYFEQYGKQLAYREMGLSQSETIGKIAERFQLSREEAAKTVEKYWEIVSDYSPKEYK